MDNKRRSVREAAQILGVRLDTLYGLIWAGKLPAEKEDGRWLIDGAAIEKRRKKQGSRRFASGNRRARRSAVNHE
jgi:excisionase family DNA binding protein